MNIDSSMSLQKSNSLHISPRINVSDKIRNNFIVKHLLQNYNNQGDPFIKMDRQNIYVVRNERQAIRMQQIKFSKQLSELNYHNEINNPGSVLNRMSMQSQDQIFLKPESDKNNEKKSPMFPLIKNSSKINLTIEPKTISPKKRNEPKIDTGALEAPLYSKQIKGGKVRNKLKQYHKKQPSFNSGGLNKQIEIQMDNIETYLQHVPIEIEKKLPNIDYTAKHGTFREGVYVKSNAHIRCQTMRSTPQLDMILKNSTVVAKVKRYQDFSNDPMKNSSETDRDLDEYITKMKIK